MGIFTDKLNKVKQRLSSAPVPKLGATKPFVSIPSPYIPSKAVAPMEFKVGVGLSPEQTKVAEATVRKVDPYIPNKTFSFKENLALFKSDIANQNLKKQGKPGISSTFLPTPEEKKQVFSSLFNPTIGTTSGLLNVGKSIMGKASPELLKWLSKTKSISEIETQMTRMGIAPDITKVYAPKLAATNTIDEVKNVLLNKTSVTPFTGRETPLEILTKAETKAGKITPKAKTSSQTPFTTPIIRELTVQEQPSLEKVNSVINGNSNNEIISYTPDFVSNDMKPRPVVFSKVIADKIIKTHGSFSPENLVLNANDWDYVIKNVDGREEKINLIKKIPNSNNFLTVAANRENGYFMVTHYEALSKDDQKLKYLLKNKGDTLDRDGRAVVPSFATSPKGAASQLDLSGVKPDINSILSSRPKSQISDEGIPLARKNVPFMPNQRVDQQPSPSLRQLDTTTGEGRSLEIAARKNIEEASQHTIPPKDVSLVETISKEPTPVKNKVNIIDYIRTPDRVLKKIGLEKEGNLLRQQHDKYLKELPKNIDKITEWSKRASKEGNEDIFRYLDGEAIDLKLQDKKVAEEIKTWLGEWADRMGLPKDNRIQYYITHIFDQELLKKEFPEELAKLIDNKLPGEVYNPFLEKRLGGLGYKKDTWAALDAYVKRATRKVHMDPALEKIKDASGKLETSAYDFVKKYVANINMRPGKVDTLIDNGIKQLIGYRLGQRPLLATTKLLRQMTYRAMLGLNPASALRNISQGINTYSKLGEKYTTIGYINLLKRGSKAELEAEGVLNSGFIEDRALSATKKALEKLDKGLFYFFETAEHINRGAAYFGAKAKGISEGMSQQQAVDYAKKIVRDTQFAFGKIDTPLVLSSDLGKTIGQFQSYTTKQIEFLLEMSKKAVKGDEKAKNFIGLLRYALAGTVFVYTIGQAFGMKITDLIPSARFGTPPSLKLPVEVGKAALNTPDKYGKERDLGQKAKDIGNATLGLIPAGIQAKKTFQGYKALKEGASKDASGRTQYDVGGTPLKNAQTLIFGKYSGQGAQDYYDNDMTYSEATLSRIQKIGKEEGKKELAKIIKENPALWEGIQKVIKKQALGITKEDEKLLNMGVATKQRAKELAKMINKLDNKEEKKALVAEFLKKKILTLEVLEQLPEFLEK